MYWLVVFAHQWSCVAAVARIDLQRYCGQCYDARQVIFLTWYWCSISQSCLDYSWWHEKIRGNIYYWLTFFTVCWELFYRTGTVGMLVTSSSSSCDINVWYSCFSVIPEDVMRFIRETSPRWFFSRRNLPKSLSVVVNKIQISSCPTQTG